MSKRDDIYKLLIVVIVLGGTGHNLDFFVNVVGFLEGLLVTLKTALRKPVTLFSIPSPTSGTR